MSNPFDPSAGDLPESELQSPLRLQLVPPRPLFTNPVEIYLANLKPTGRRTQRSKLEKVARLFGVSINDFGLSYLTYQTVISARAVLQEAQAPQSVNSTLSALKGVAKAAWEIGLLSLEEFTKIKGVAIVRGSRIPPGRALTDEELALLIGACEADQSAAGVRDAGLLGLMFSAGLRRVECTSLRIMDYSSQARALLVRGKGNKERVAPLEDQCVVRALNDWLKLRGREAGPIFCRILKSGAVKASTKPLSEQAIYNVVKNRAVEAGIGNVTPHDARRTLITNLIEDGGDLGAIQDLVGHSSIATTSKYKRTRDQAKRKAAGLHPLPYRGRRIPTNRAPAPEQLELPTTNTRHERL